MSNQLTLSQKNAREQDGRTEVEAMTMAQLSKERVTFGAKYVNYTYQHMWDNHPDWIQFMVDRYANSEMIFHLLTCCATETLWYSLDEWTAG